MKRIKRSCTSHSCEVLRLHTCHQVTYQMNRTDNEAAEVALTMLGTIAREGVRVLTYRMNTGSLSCLWRTFWNRSNQKRRWMTEWKDSSRLIQNQRGLPFGASLETGIVINRTGQIAIRTILFSLFILDL